MPRSRCDAGRLTSRLLASIDICAWRKRRAWRAISTTSRAIWSRAFCEFTNRRVPTISLNPWKEDSLLRKRLLLIVLVCMLSLPLSALAGKTLDGGYCDVCDNATCFCGPDGTSPRSIRDATPKRNVAPAGSEEGILTSGAFVLASLILLLL